MKGRPASSNDTPASRASARSTTSTQTQYAGSRTLDASGYAPGNVGCRARIGFSGPNANARTLSAEACGASSSAHSRSRKVATSGRGVGKRRTRPEISVCSIRPEFGPLACNRGLEWANSTEGTIMLFVESAPPRVALRFGILADYASYRHGSFDKIYLILSSGLLG